MNIADWLQTNIKILDAAGIGTARLDAEVLLADAFNKNRPWIIAHPEQEIGQKILKDLNDKIKRRMRHDPLAYIRNKTEFFGREFYVDESVLEPRPESETMIEMCLKLLDEHSNATSVIDIGTGSGALAITVKLEMPHIPVYGTDIDPCTLLVANKNKSSYKADITFLEGDLCEPIIEKLADESIIIANLPYVADSYHINPAALNEPMTAIFGGPDGLDVYRSMFRQISGYSTRPRFILTESMPYQHEKLRSIAKKYGYLLKNSDDFIQLFTLAGNKH